jgi:hypothetical protein
MLDCHGRIPESASLASTTAALTLSGAPMELNPAGQKIMIFDFCV